MNRIRFGTREDAAKKRREYLWRKGLANSTILSVCLIGGVTVLGALLAIIITVTLLTSMGSPVRGLGLGAAIGVPALLMLKAIDTYRNQVRKARMIPYVPPVREQLAALPADKILVRGSDQPAAAPGELLRAARTGAETEAGELLRPNQRQTEQGLQQIGNGQR